MTRSLSCLLVAVLVSLVGCGRDDEAAPGTAAPAVDGRLEAGLRVLTIDPARADAVYRIYRGDYVRFERPDAEPFTVTVPSRGAAKSYPVAAGDRTYVKFPDAGRFPFQVGDLEGVIEALDFRAAAYREVSATDAAAFIDALQPLVLDVRTEREFNGGHLAGAQLVPVQVFGGRMPELQHHRDRPVLVYCRTGNRSTVAAKLLVDAGFTNVVNLRRGIVEWEREGLPTEQ